jgi:hypothetical protein
MGAISKGVANTLKSAKKYTKTLVRRRVYLGLKNRFVFLWLFSFLHQTIKVQTMFYVSVSHKSQPQPFTSRMREIASRTASECQHFAIFANFMFVLTFARSQR